MLNRHLEKDTEKPNKATNPVVAPAEGIIPTSSPYKTPKINATISIILGTFLVINISWCLWW